MLPLLLTLALAVAPPLTPISPRLMTVTADAKLTLLPNQLVGTLQVTAKDRDQAGARKGTDEKLRKVVAALKAAGVEARAMVLHDTAVVPEYRGNEVVGHTAVRNLTLTLSDLTRVDEVLTAAMRAGAQPHGPILLRNSDHRVWEEKGRIAAANAARVRATAILEALGAKLGLPRSVTDQTPQNQGQVSGHFVAGPDGAVVTGFAATELTVIAQVSVQFDIRDDG